MFQPFLPRLPDPERGRRGFVGRKARPFPGGTAGAERRAEPYLRAVSGSDVKTF